jgi:outer membrane protein TolC
LDAGPRLLTLDEALRRAQQHNPSVRGAQAGVDAASEREAVAMSPYLPSLSATAAYNRQTGNTVPRPGATTVPSGSSLSGESYNSYNFALNLQQTIWDFGRTKHTVDLSKAGTKAARAALETTELASWHQVVTSYYAVLAAQEMVGVAERSTQVAQRYAERAQGLFDAGARPRIDVVRTKAELHNAQAAQLLAQDTLLVSKASLLAAIGTRDSLDFTVEQPPAAPPEQAPTNAEAAVEEALSTRPERHQLMAQLAAQDALIAARRAGHFPTLGFGASVTEGGVAFDDMAWNWTAGVLLTVPIFAGLSTFHLEREARAYRRVLAASLEQLGLAVWLDVQRAAARLTDAVTRMQPVSSTLEAAQEAVQLAEGRYEAGAGNYMELLDSQTFAANAEAETVRARLDLAVAYATWRRALGRVASSQSAKESP